jgi:hypothetical protein
MEVAQMKKLYKIVSLLLVAALLLTGSTVALASGIFTEEITLTGLNDLSVRQAARNYMDIRADFLLGESDGMNWLVNGINNDEAAHLAKLTDESIALIDTSYVIDSVECADTMAIVFVTESVYYSKNGTSNTALISHELTVMLHDETTPVVAADGYTEIFSGFESCSYVAPIAETYTTNATTSPGGSSLCILQVAIGQIGYEEDDPVANTNVTKYGTELGYPGQPWCVLFVSWCAKHANVDASIIKRHSNCDTLKTFFMDQGTFNYSPAQSGTYVPVPGDIVFKGTDISDSTHVGIVEKVEGEYVYMIDGNGTYNDVSRNRFKLSATNVLGYGHPNYENSNHVASEYTCTSGLHSGTCMNCSVEFEATHEMLCGKVDGDCHQAVCAICQYSITSAHIMGTTLCSDNTNHWYECGDCGYQEDVEAHAYGSYRTNSSGHWQECTECGITTDLSVHRYVTQLDGSKVCKICSYLYIEPSIKEEADNNIDG